MVPVGYVFEDDVCDNEVGPRGRKRDLKTKEETEATGAPKRDLAKAKVEELPISLFYIERGLHSRREKGERGTRKRTTYVECKQLQGQVHPPPPPIQFSVFSDLGQNRGRPPFRSLKVLQLNLDSNCDFVRIFGAVIGHLEAEIDF